MQRYTILLAILFAVLLLACSGDRSAQSDGPAPTVVNTRDYVFVNVAKPLLLRVQMLSGDQIGLFSERYYPCEKVIVDRLIDNNGNGVYDPGIDSFEDFNHNNRYDPPPDSLAEGFIPRWFDDLNSNGLHDCAAGGPYFVGLPYFDANRNSKWDSNQPFLVDVGRWDTIIRPARLPAVGFVRVSNAFRFVSDSSIAYQLEGSGVLGPSLGNSSLGVCFSNSPGLLFARPGQLHVGGTDIDSFTLNDTLFRVRRTVDYIERYATPETLLTNIIHIRVDSLYINDTLRNCPYTAADAWFAKGRGLVALSAHYCSGYPTSITWWTSNLIQSIPVPMRR